METKSIRERMLKLLSFIDMKLATSVADYLGLAVPKDNKELLNGSFPADANPSDYQSTIADSTHEKSAALSMEHTLKNSIKTRQIAFLVADGVNEKSVDLMKEKLEEAGAVVDLVAPKLCDVISENNTVYAIKKSFLTTASVLYDAVYVPGGTNSVASIAAEPDALHFLNEAFKHCKAIAADGDAIQVLSKTYFAAKLPTALTEDEVMEKGLAIGKNADKLATLFIKAIAQHRFWNREKVDKVPA